MRTATNPFAAPHTAAKPAPAGENRYRIKVLAPLAATLRLWIEREGQRRELAGMSARDFGDVVVPDSLIRDELRRWPWQRPSPEWHAVGGARRPVAAEQLPAAAGCDRPAIVPGLPLPGLELALRQLAAARRRGGEE